MSDERIPIAPTPFVPGAGGPSLGQFLGTLQQILQALVGANAAETSLLNAVIAQLLPRLQLSEIVAPTAPTSGFIIYVDSTTHHLMAVGSSGTRTSLANP